MGDQEQYQRHAEFAMDMARRAVTEKSRKSWLKIAADWLTLLPWGRPLASGSQDTGDTPLDRPD